MDNITNYACDYGIEETDYRAKIAKLDVEKTKLYMESRDIKIALDNITYRKKIISIVFITGMVISAILFGIFTVTWLYSFRMYDVYGEWLNYIAKIVMVIFAIVFIIMAVPYFCMMSQEYFWIKCANLFRFEKIEMQRKSYIREMSAIEKRCAEIDKEVSELTKKISLLKEG